MSHPERILWGEGMFLLPQHFQQTDCYWEDRLADVAASVHAHPWGIRAIAWDKESLGRGLLQADQLELTFQDGTAFRAPAKAPLPIPRQLADIPGLEAENLVYAVLPAWNAFGGNIESDTARGRLPRFRHAPHPTPDLFTTAVEGEVVTLTPNVSLMVAGENRDGCLSVPVGRLLRTPTGTWTRGDHPGQGAGAVRFAPGAGQERGGLRGFGRGLLLAPAFRQSHLPAAEPCPAVSQHASGDTVPCPGPVRQRTADLQFLRHSGGPARLRPREPDRLFRQA